MYPLPPRRTRSRRFRPSTAALQAQAGQDPTIFPAFYTRPDLARTFGYLRQHSYKGYCSIEWDSPGDPYAGTADLIAKTVHYLA